MSTSKKGLGRGLSALIPDGDMEFLSRVARGDQLVALPTSRKDVATGSDVAPPASPSNTSRSRATKVVVRQTGLSPDNDAATGSGAKVTIDSLKSRLSDEQHIDVNARRSIAAQGDKTPGKSSSETLLTAPQAPIEWLALNEIEVNPFQPRRHFAAAEMSELVDSIRTHGVIQPILVRPLTDPSRPDLRYQLVAGERRWRAAQTAQLKQVPAVVRAVDDQQSLELALIENVQRHDISALDAALAYKRLSSEFNLSQESVAQRVGKSRSAVANTMRLLDLPEEVQRSIAEGALSEGHARAILLAKSEGGRRALFRRVLRDGLSVREVERFAREAEEDFSARTSKSEPPTQSAGESARQADIEVLLREIRKTLGTKIGHRAKKRGGQILIEYRDDKDFKRLAEVFQGLTQSP